MLKILFMAWALSVFTFAGEVRLAIASNLSDVIDALQAEFIKMHSHTKVSYVLGSSGKLAAQIINGASYDIFLSANMTFPENLYQHQMTMTQPVVYASGALAMMSVKGLDMQHGMALLKEKSIAKIAIANPKTAPYGTATLEAFKNANVYEAIVSKLVYAESISHAVQFATTAADIGFVNKSIFYGAKMKQYQEGKDWVEVDRTLYTPIAQGVVMLKTAQNNADAKAFYEFLLSASAKKIFKEYGYIVHE